MVDLDTIESEAVQADGKDGRPGSFIQWKGTELCADFHCPCGGGGHIDAMFAYSLHCPACDRRWHLSPRLLVREMKPGEFDEGESVVELWDRDDGTTAMPVFTTYWRGHRCPVCAVMIKEVNTTGDGDCAQILPCGCRWDRSREGQWRHQSGHSRG